ncbi:MAG: SOS response-associated peptidase family protein, partial [Pseudomonas fluorescens]
PENLVLHFNPRPAQDMFVACLWSHWQAPNAKDLYSFAAVSDDPPPEIAAAGHNRCPVALKPENVDAWLSPQKYSSTELLSLLADRQMPYYEHRIAA